INSLFIEEREGNNYFSVSRAGRTLDFISITINSNSKIFYPTDNQIVSLALKKGFISAYLVDSDYEFVQTEKFSNKFKGKSIPQKILDSIKNTPAKPETWGGMEYNTKFNPGRSI